MRLTKPQKRLLIALQSEEGAWCECFGDEYRTAKSLQNLGLIEISEEWGPVKTHDDRFEARSISGQIRQAESDKTFVYELGPKGSNRWSFQINHDGSEGISREDAEALAFKISEFLRGEKS